MITILQFEFDHFWWSTITQLLTYQISCWAWHSSAQAGRLVCFFNYSDMHRLHVASSVCRLVGQSVGRVKLLKIFQNLMPYPRITIFRQHYLFKHVQVRSFWIFAWMSAHDTSQLFIRFYWHSIYSCMNTEYRNRNCYQGFLFSVQRGGGMGPPDAKLHEICHSAKMLQ